MRQWFALAEVIAAELVVIAGPVAIVEPAAVAEPAATELVAIVVDIELVGTAIVDAVLDFEDEAGLVVVGEAAAEVGNALVVHGVVLPGAERWESLSHPLAVKSEPYVEYSTVAHMGSLAYSNPHCKPFYYKLVNRTG